MLLTYGQVCSIQVDPIEKKPLLHLLPGSSVLSLAAAGCNLRCRGCQNWEIAQTKPAAVPHQAFLPVQLPALARAHHCPSVAYTYTEPLVAYEFTRDCCQSAQAAGLRNILVTAAYVQPEPLRALAPWVDAANVDLKGFSEEFYRSYCGAALAPVLEALRILHAAGTHLEITNLVIPTLNDDDKQLGALAGWVVRHLGPETPLHFSRFFPHHQLNHLPATPLETLLRARTLAVAEGLKHVYIGNVALPGAEDTRCAACDRLLIRREGYTLLENRLARGSPDPRLSAG